MTVMSAPFLTLITFLVAGIFEGMGHEPAQVELERTYYLILMSGVLVTLAKVCISSYFAGIGRTHVVMICDVFGLVINVPLCYVMVFGKLGFPALGIVVPASPPSSPRSWRSCFLSRSTFVRSTATSSLCCARFRST